MLESRIQVITSSMYIKSWKGGITENGGNEIREIYYHRGKI